MVLRVLDLFAGLEGWSKPWRERGHDVLTLDLDPRFGSDIQADILKWDPATLPWRPDVILASPPCEGFSVASMGRSWVSDGNGGIAGPKSATARLGLEIVTRTLDVIQDLDPGFWVMENPRAALRKMTIVQHLERQTVTYCTLGDVAMKPTDLWSDRWQNVPSLVLPEPCKTDRTHSVWIERPGAALELVEYRVNLRTGKPCHEVARRGAKTGTQGKTDSAARAEIPRALSVLIMEACERDFSVSAQSQSRLPDPQPPAIGSLSAENVMPVAGGLRNIESW